MRRPENTLKRLSAVLCALFVAMFLFSPSAGAQDEAAPEEVAAVEILEPLTEVPSTSSSKTQILLFFTFVLAIFLGFELISKVPSQLHTPLMSGANAISGITIVGALLAAGATDSPGLATALGFLAVTCATINVVGGYLVTDRMLGMFKSKAGKN